MRTFYDEITMIAGTVVTVKAQGVGYDELAVISTAHGESLAQVIRLEDDQVSLQVFGGTEGVSNGDKIRFLDLKVMMPSQTRRLTRHSQSQSARERALIPAVTTGGHRPPSRSVTSRESGTR